MALKFVTAVLKAYITANTLDTFLILMEDGGWNSYRERWFFETHFFNVTASDSPYDLPIYIKMVQASRHDSITTIFALQDIRKLYPDLHFKNFLADGAIDNYPTYELLKHYDIRPFISLDSRTKTKFNYPHPVIPCFDDKGNPICKGGIPFIRWGYLKPKGIKYRCWFAAKGLDPQKNASVLPVNMVELFISSLTMT